jgi:hypothetical protein
MNPTPQLKESRPFGIFWESWAQNNKQLLCHPHLSQCLWYLQTIPADVQFLGDAKGSSSFQPFFHIPMFDVNQGRESWQ